MQPSPRPKAAPINRKAPARRTGAFHRMSVPPPEGMEHGHSDPFSSRKLEREPGGERLHAVTLDIVAVPHRERDGHGHSCLELRVVRIACFHRTLHDYAPGRAAIAAALDGTGRLPHAVADDILMG